jgi:hypothetical protein
VAGLVPMALLSLVIGTCDNEVRQEDPEGLEDTPQSIAGSQFSAIMYLQRH